jgi:phosphoribosylanthranilate isomerase
MTWIKICGTTNLEDAQLAVDAGADAVGFVFHNKSPRNIDLKSAAGITSKLPVEIEKVGVFVDETADRIESVVRDAGLTAVQVYSGSGTPVGSSSADGLKIRNFKLIVALSSDQLIPGHLITGPFPGMMVYAILVDSGSGARPGGTGERFNWLKSQQMIQGLGMVQKVIVAGGLTPANVREAMNVLRPWGVDVVSGIEVSRGKKDPAKLKAFVKNVRDLDQKAN